MEEEEEEEGEEEEEEEEEEEKEEEEEEKLLLSQCTLVVLMRVSERHNKVQKGKKTTKPAYPPWGRQPRKGAHKTTALHFYPPHQKHRADHLFGTFESPIGLEGAQLGRCGRGLISVLYLSQPLELGVFFGSVFGGQEP